MYQRNNTSYNASGHKGPANLSSFGNGENSDTVTTEAPIPRVTANMLSSFCNQRVALFGRAIGVDHDNKKVHIQCPLSGETLILPVKMSGKEDLQFSVHNEFILEVGRSPKEVTLCDHTSLTDNFDFDSYKYLMQLMWGHCATLFH